MYKGIEHDRGIANARLEEKNEQSLLEGRTRYSGIPMKNANCLFCSTTNILSVLIIYMLYY